MDLQTVFYSLGIVFMSLSIFIFVALLVLVFYIWKKVVQLQKIVEEKIDDITNRPGEIATEIGAKMVSQAVKKAKDYLSR